MKGCRVCLFALLITCSLQSWSQCSTITDLKEGNFTAISLYFYPSTLRMVNLENNERFNRLIQDIKKLVFYKMSKKFEAIDMYNLISELQSENEFEEYVVLDGPKKKFYLLGREKPTESVGVALVNNEHYVFDIAGSLELKEILKLYEYMAENDSIFEGKFSQILGLLKTGQDVPNNNH